MSGRAHRSRYCPPVEVLAGRAHIDDQQLALVRSKLGLPIEDPALAIEPNIEDSKLRTSVRDIRALSKVLVSRAGGVASALAGRVTLGFRRQATAARS